MIKQQNKEVSGYKILAGAFLLCLVIGCFAACQVLDHDQRIQKLEDQQKDELLLQRDTVYTEDGQMLIYETKVRKPRKGDKIWR